MARHALIEKSNWSQIAGMPCKCIFIVYATSTVKTHRRWAVVDDLMNLMNIIK